MSDNNPLPRGAAQPADYRTPAFVPLPPERPEKRPFMCHVDKVWLKHLILRCIVFAMLGGLLAAVRTMYLESRSSTVVVTDTRWTCTSVIYRQTVQHGVGWQDELPPGATTVGQPIARHRGYHPCRLRPCAPLFRNPNSMRVVRSGVLPYFTCWDECPYAGDWTRYTFYRLERFAFQTRRGRNVPPSWPDTQLEGEVLREDSEAVYEVNFREERTGRSTTQRYNLRMFLGLEQGQRYRADWPAHGVVRLLERFQ